MADETTAPTDSAVQAALVRERLATRLTPYLMALDDQLQKIKNDKKTIIAGIMDNTDHIQFITPLPVQTEGKKAAKSVSPLRARYMEEYPGQGTAKATTKAGNIRAFVTDHVFSVKFAGANGLFEYEAYAIAVGTVPAPLSASNMQLVARKDFAIVHDPALDVRPYYKINRIEDLPRITLSSGIKLYICDMRYIVIKARAEVLAELKTEANGGVSSTYVPAPRTRRTPASTVTLLNKMHKEDTMALDYVTMPDEPAEGQLPSLIFNNNKDGMEAVRHLLGRQYTPLSQSAFERRSFWPAGVPIEHEQIHVLTRDLLCGGHTPSMLYSFPWVQALFLSWGCGIDQAFWDFHRCKSDGVMPHDVVDEFVQVAETDSATHYAEYCILSSMCCSRKIFNHIKENKSVLLATATPLEVACRLITSVGSCKKVKFQPGHQKLPVCALSGHVIVPEETAWCFMCPVRSIVVDGTDRGFVLFFVSAMLLPERTKMKNAVVYDPPVHLIVPVVDAADDAEPMLVDTWAPVQ